MEAKDIMNDITSTVTGIIGRDLSTVGGFSERQLTGIADQAVTVARGIASGEITPATRQFFLDQLVEASQNFARTLVGLILVTIEKVWNAIVNILYGVISGICGITLTPPSGN